MRIVSIHEANLNLSRLIDAVADGDVVVIAKAGKPMVRMVPFVMDRARRIGGLKGKIRIADDFDAPLPDDLLAAFEGRWTHSARQHPTGLGLRPRGLEAGGARGGFRPLGDIQVLEFIAGMQSLRFVVGMSDRRMHAGSQANPCQCRPTYLDRSLVPRAS